ncbi:hypothetical protein [Treponema endosymbiont of Eucomonympha sp.]|uniref:hypothetical protein n=1 Tax=Treponema endosymbiont of Eucomonympha sp. TaxID=1580831 RepID=UPI0016506E4C|nr:hypothetical protein [Treponema endosymbiont of Eucomonympha sp.]
MNRNEGIHRHDISDLPLATGNPTDRRKLICRSTGKRLSRLPRGLCRRRKP